MKTTPLQAGFFVACTAIPLNSVAQLCFPLARRRVMVWTSGQSANLETRVPDHTATIEIKLSWWNVGHECVAQFVLKQATGLETL